jgi:hypothetical protein
VGFLLCLPSPSPSPAFVSVVLPWDAGQRPVLGIPGCWNSGMFFSRDIGGDSPFGASPDATSGICLIHGLG